MIENIPNEDDVVEALILTYKIDKYGAKCYYNKEGNLHRIHGPAKILKDGTKIWFKNGNWHRENGPAYMHVNGYEEYWIDGNQYTKGAFIQWQIEHGIKLSE